MLGWHLKVNFLLLFFRRAASQRHSLSFFPFYLVLHIVEVLILTIFLLNASLIISQITTLFMDCSLSFTALYCAGVKIIEIIKFVVHCGFWFWAPRPRLMNLLKHVGCLFSYRVCTHGLVLLFFFDLSLAALAAAAQRNLGRFIER